MTQRLLISGYIVLTALLVPTVVQAQGARLRLDHLARLADKADETVDVNVDTAMLKQAAGFLAGKGRDAHELNELINDISGIYVKSFKFSAPGGYTESDVESVRKQLTGSRWSRVVSTKERGELSEIYFFSEKNDNGGLVVIAAEANELTVVNIVGRVNLASLAALGSIIPKLPGAIGGAVPKR
jgi:hypothetical protein